MVYNNNTLIIYKSQNFFQSQTHALHELDDLVSDDVIFSKATIFYSVTTTEIVAARVITALLAVTLAAPA